METVRRTATHPETGDKYQIELPDPAVIRQAILELPCPPNGMMPKETSKRLAEKLKLSEEQKNAGYKGGDNIFYFMVALAFDKLSEEGKLKQPGGPYTPYFLVDETPKPFPPIDPPTPDELIEEKYQKRIDELTHELLQQIREKHPGFTVELTVSLKKTS